MAIFGYTVKGASSVYGANYLTACKFLCPENGQAESITVYLKQYLNSTPRVKCGIYIDNNGYPGALVGYTEEWTLTSGWDDWKTLNIVSGGELQANTYYWLVLFNSDYVYRYYDPGETNQYIYKSYTYSDFPNPFPSDGTYQARKLSIYCTYTPSAGIIKQWSQTGITSHLFSRPVRLMKMTQNLGISNIASTPILKFKFAKTPDLTHIFVRHRSMRFTKALQTFHAWTTIYPSLILKQWIASLKLTHNFRRPNRIVRLPAHLQVNHFYGVPIHFMRFLERLGLAHTVYLAIPGVKKTRLFLVIGDLAIQITGD
ncbi:MAG: hypothetical protein QXZ68_05305 [Candidatus Bathyarchaeia archaeon]